MATWTFGEDGLWRDESGNVADEAKASSLTTRAIEGPEKRTTGQNIAGGIGRGAIALPGLIGDITQYATEGNPKFGNVQYQMRPTEALETMARAGGVPVDYDKDSLAGRASDFITSGLLGGGASRAKKAKGLIAGGVGKVRAYASQFGREAGQGAAAAASSYGVERATQDVENPWVRGAANFAAPLLPQLGMLGLAAGTRRAAIGGAGDQVVQDAAAFKSATGGDPMLHQIAPNDRVMLGERGLSFTGAGAVPFAKRMEAQADDFATKTRDIAGGANKSGAQAGEIVERGIFGPSGYIKRGADEAESLYNDYFSKLPQDYRFQLTNTKKALDDFLGRYAADPEFKPLLDDPAFVNLRKVIQENEVNALTQRNGLGPQVSTVRALRTDYGKLMGKRSAVPGDSATGELKDIYRALSKDLEQAALDKGGGAIDAFKAADAHWTGYRDKIDRFLKPLEGKDVERMYDTVRNGTADQADAVIGSLTRDEQKAFSEVFINRLGLARKKQGDFEFDVYSPNAFLNNWKELTPRVQAALIPNATQRVQITEMAKQYDKMLRGGKIVFNTSGTTGSGMLASQIVAFISGLGTAAAGAATGNPTLALAGLGLSGATGASLGISHWAASKMADPKLVQWISDANKIPSVAVPGHIARLTRIDFGSEEDNKMRDSLAQMLSARFNPQ